MVHGGGHHSRHTWSPPNSVWSNSNLTRNNNNNNNRTGNGYYHNNLSQVPEGGDHSESCCSALVCCGCTSLFCVGFWKTCGPKIGAWIFLSFVFWVVLLGLATYSPAEDQFELDVGETWQIVTPPFWSRTSFGISASTTDPGLEVYSFPPVVMGKYVSCPIPGTEDKPLSLVSNNDTMTLHVDEYQYDYFHLNAGSTINARIRQISGSTNIYLLQGAKAVQTLRGDDEDNDMSIQSVRAQSILKRYSAEGKVTTIKYDVMEPDLYALVYDNAGGWDTSTKISVSLNLNLATYPLPLTNRICKAKDTVNTCKWDLYNDMDRDRLASTCIVVKAVAANVTAILQAPPTPTGSIPSIPLDSNHVVSVQVTSEIGSPTLFALATAPFVAGVLAIVLYKMFFGSWGSDPDDSAFAARQPKYTAVPAKEHTPKNGAYASARNPTYMSTMSSDDPSTTYSATIPMAHAVALDGTSSYQQQQQLLPTAYLQEGITPLPPPTNSTSSAGTLDSFVPMAPPRMV